VLTFSSDPIIDGRRHEREAATAFLVMTDHILTNHREEAEEALRLTAYLQGFLVMTYFDDPPNCEPALRPMLAEMQRAVHQAFDAATAEVLSQPAGEATDDDSDREPEPLADAELSADPR
jgi:hypothetical protein